MAEFRDGTIELTRGTVVYVRNENASGHVVSGTHPAVVIQNDIGNKYSPTVIVVFLTSQMKRCKGKYRRRSGLLQVCHQEKLYPRGKPYPLCGLRYAER